MFAGLKNQDMQTKKDSIFKYILASAILGPGYSAFFWYFDSYTNVISPAIFTVTTLIAYIAFKKENFSVASYFLAIPLFAAPACEGTPDNTGRVANVSSSLNK